MLERMRSKWNTPRLLVGLKTCIATLEISMAVSQRSGINLTQDPVIPLLDIYPKNAQSYHNNTCPIIFIAALFITVRKHSMILNQRMNKENVVHLHI